MVKRVNLKTLKGLLTLFLLVLLISEGNAQNEVAIGSNITKSNAILWLNGNGSQGLILPIVTSKNAVNGPDKGMIVYDNSDNKVWYRSDNAWVEVGGGTSGGDNGSLKLQIQGNQIQLQDGATTLSTVNIAGGTPSDGAFMVWNGSSWQSTPISDVNGTNGQVTGMRGKSLPALPATTQALVYNGSAWTFQPLTGSDSQTLTFTSPNLSISNGNSVNLSALDKDAQTLALTGSSLSISGGNSVTLPSTGVTSVTAGTGLTGGTITTTGTLNVDVGTTANKVVQLDATGKLPAVDGSQLTNLPSIVEIGDISAVVAGPGLTGGGTTGAVSLSLANSSVTPGIYGSATAIPQVTVDAFGRITAVTTFPPLVADGSITGGTPGVGVKIAANTITDANILSLNASKINSGTLPIAQVPNLDASKITTGTFNTAQIPNLDASKITSGIIPTTQGGTGLNLSSGSVGNGQLLIGNNAGFAKANLTAGSGINITDGPGSITISSTTTGTVSSVTGTAPISVVTGTSTPVISISQAGASTSGFLSSADWNTFNGKGSGTVTSINAGTGLSGGPITTTGTLSLANTAVTPGSYGTTTTVPQLTIDQQGRITAASSQTIPTANTTTTGLLTNTDWNTFNSKGNGTVTNVTGSGPISVVTGSTTPAISITQAGASTNGFLSSVDWNTFNSKQGALTLTTTGTSGAATLSGNTLNIPQYSSSYLAGTGLTLTGNTFSVNTSQNISALSNLATNGLIKTSGGTGALSIATPGTDYLVTETDPAVTAINGIVKSNGITLSAAAAGIDYVVPNAAITGATATKITFDAKGLVTAGTSLVAGDIPNIAESQVTDLVTDLAGKQPQLNGTGFVRASGTTITYDNSTYLTSFTETDPAVTAINGIVKSNGTTISAAAAGTDFVAPNAAITGATATKITYDAKGLVTSGAALAATDIPDLDASKITSGILPVTNGGTGKNTWSGLVYGSGATLGDISDGTAGQFLRIVGTTPSWQTFSIVDADVNAAAAITGTKINPDFGTQNITTTGTLNTGGLSASSTITFTALAGLGNRSVTVDNTGLISAQTLGTLATLNAVTTSEITDATITDADVSPTAAIAGTKITPSFGAQNISTTGSLVTGALQVTGGTIASGRVLTSDAAGNATWQPAGAGSGWSLTGNATIAANFIGTTNAQPLNFKVNNDEAGIIDPTNFNTTFGQLSGASLTSGTQNTAFGYNSLNANSTGVENTAIGYNALRINTVTSYNTAVGRSALFNQTAGSFGSNTAIGYQALYQNTTGYLNTSLGYQAGSTQGSVVGTTTGNNNTFIGANAGPTSATLTNATAIGAGATVNASNKVRIGNASVTVVEGQVSYSNSSDKRLKNSIKEIDFGLDFIKKLKPVSYLMNNSDSRKNWGFIAQDIETLLGTDNAILTVGDDSLRTLSLRYTDFIAPMVKAMQEQQTEIEELKAKLKEKDQKVNALESSVTAIKDELEEIKRILGVEAKAKAVDKKLK